MPELVQRRYDVFNESLAHTHDGVSVSVKCAFLVALKTDGSINAIQRAVRVMVNGAEFEKGSGYPEDWVFRVSEDEIKSIASAVDKMGHPSGEPVADAAADEDSVTIGQWLRIGVAHFGERRDRYYLQFFASGRSIKAYFDRFFDLRQFPALMGEALATQMPV